MSARAALEIPPKLIPIFQGSADVRGACGGRGSGKTRTFALMTAVRAYMWDKAWREGVILCGRQFMNSLAESSFDEIKYAIRAHPWLDDAFDIGEKYIRTKSRRISYSFSGLDRNVDSIKSKSRILLCWIDEAEPTTEGAYVKLIPTLRDEESELWVTWNPESRRSPTHKRFRESTPDERVKIAEINYKDNYWFPKILERTRLRDLSDRPEQYEHVWEGGFATIFVGAYYSKELNALRLAGRINSNVVYDPALPVHTAWDLGIGDSTAIWFFQVVANEVRIIDYYENHGFGLPHYVDILKARGYAYGDHWLPHDARVRELGTGRTRVETLAELGLKNLKLVPAHTIDDGIAAARKALPRCLFNETTCEAGLDALRQYRTEFDDDKQAFSDKPRHDWTSHGADSFRYLSMAYKTIAEPEAPKPLVVGVGLNEMTVDQFFEFSDDGGRERRERV